jgi:hypothetical protein
MIGREQVTDCRNAMGNGGLARACRDEIFKVAPSGLAPAPRHQQASYSNRHADDQTHCARTCGDNQLHPIGPSFTIV